MLLTNDDHGRHDTPATPRRPGRLLAVGLAMGLGLASSACTSLKVCVDETAIRGYSAPDAYETVYLPPAANAQSQQPTPTPAAPPAAPANRNGIQPVPAAPAVMNGQNTRDAATTHSQRGEEPASPLSGGQYAADHPAASQSDLAGDKTPTTPLHPGFDESDSAVDLTRELASQLVGGDAAPAAASGTAAPAPSPPGDVGGQRQTATAAPSLTAPVAGHTSAPEYYYCEDNRTGGSFKAWAGSFIGKFSVDHSQAEARALAEACQTNPCDQPSHAEVRKAKADAQVEAELKAQGGDLMVKPDGSSSDPTQVKFVAAPGALAMRIAADGKLNEIDGVPHALMLIVYHLSDRTAFDQLTTHPDGLRKLLEGAPFDPSVKGVRQIFVQPGLTGELAMERAEDGRYVALVAGFSDLNTASSVFVTSYSIGSSTKKNGMLQRSTTIFTPRPLNLEVKLGQNSMAVLGVGEIFDNVKNSTPL